MRTWRAALGSAVFFVLTPGMVVGVIPLWITGWRVQLSWAPPVRFVGLVLLVAGIAVLVQAFGRFVFEGRGTPSPTAPTQRLVVGGLYRYVRNPMYVAVLTAIVGQALWFGQPVLLGYAVLVWAAVVSFVRWYEEPHLAERYGEGYRAYRDAVPGWIPRVRLPLLGEVPRVWVVSCIVFAGCSSSQSAVSPCGGQWPISFWSERVRWHGSRGLQ
jgi:protein-S-isoprenylcysteine O-methyltransferase Ste14